MSTLQLSDIVEPKVFTDYIVDQTMKKTAFVQSGVAVKNAAMARQLAAGAHSYTIPYWKDLSDDEADIASDDPSQKSVPRKIGSGKQVVRKSFLHASWGAMNLASEIAGDDALARIQSRVAAYWTRQTQARLISSLRGVKAANVANHNGDMVVDVSAKSGQAANFSASALIDASNTLGDSMSDLTAVAMHSAVYAQALRNDLIEFIKDSQNQPFATFRGLAAVVDDGLPVDSGVYTSVLFGRGAVGYASAAPEIAAGTEVESTPAAGNGGGEQVLHSRMNMSVHPLGFTFLDDNVAGESPTIAELADPTNWTRTIERKATPIAFLASKVG